MVSAAGAASVILLAAAQAPAQNNMAGFYGTVQDASGAYIPEAVVVVRNLETTKRELVRTDTAGEFRLAALPSGKYVVSISKPGFQLRMQDMDLQAGSAQQVAFVLDVGRISETVNISGARTGAAPEKASGTAAPVRLRIGGNVQAARLVHQVKPIYPVTAREQGVQGSVLLDAVIGRDGRILNLEVANTLVHPDLVQAAVEAVRQWEYEPTFLNGEPVEISTVITINFTLLP